MTRIAEAAVSRRALFGLGFTRALEGAGLEAGPPRAASPVPAPAFAAGEADATRLGAELGPLARVVLRRLLAPGGGDDLLVVAAGDGTPVVDLALAAGHHVTAVEGDPVLRERGGDRQPLAGWHATPPAGAAQFDVVLAWFGATYDDEPGALAAALRGAARPGGLIAVAAWTPAAMARLRPGPPPPGHRPEHWSRYETAYRHFFELPDLDVEPLDGPGGLEAALVLARAPGHRARRLSAAAG